LFDVKFFIISLMFLKILLKHFVLQYCCKEINILYYMTYAKEFTLKLLQSNTTRWLCDFCIWICRCSVCLAEGPHTDSSHWIFNQTVKSNSSETSSFVYHSKKKKRFCLRRRERRLHKGIFSSLTTMPVRINI
jgi:type IV secretory pathway VirB6-like protein